MIKVYQIQMTNKQYDRVNEVGHAQAAAEIPAYDAHMNCSFRGSKGFKADFFKHYSVVATIDTADLEDAFTVGNIGPESRLNRIAPMHSISVGDILERDGRFFMVDPCGFQPVVTA